MTRGGDDPLPGTVLGGCRMESLIGRGGMGAVYRAHHLALDKPVAVKVLAPHLAGDREYVGRFVLEARAAARVEHPNVIHVINVAHERELYFIVMTFVEGESAEQVLRREGRLEEGRATAIVRDVAAGLGALHREGIIHRDIKPANILLGRDGTVKITDFGLARKVEHRTGFTADGAFMGTPEFVSPEQAEGLQIDPRSDLYSLGVTYYQLLSGLLPFQGMSSVDVAAKHMRDVPPSLGEVIPGVDPRAAAVVHRLLQKGPEDRHPDADALIVDLEGILEAPAPAGVSAAPPADPVHVSPTVPSPRPAPVPKPEVRVARSPAAVYAGQVLRAAAFWGLAVLALGCCFSAGALGAAVRGEGFLEGLPRPFQSPDDGLPMRIALGALAVVAMVTAFIFNRGNLRGASHPFAGGCLLGLAGLGFYVGGVHGPVAGPGGSAIGVSLAGVMVARTHLGHLAFVAGWGVLTGIALGCGRGSGRFARISGALAVFVSLGLVTAFAAGGAVQAVWEGLKANMGVLLVATAGLSTALLGIYMAFGSRRRAVTRIPGILLILVAVVGHYLVGSLATFRPDSAGSLLDPLAGMGEALIAQQGFVTVAALLALWSVWFLRNRSILLRQTAPF